MIGKYSCRLTFETALKLRGGPSLVLAHSLGNNVFRYFLEWLKLEIPPKQYIKWLDEHIHAYFAVGKISLHLNYFLLGRVISMIVDAHYLALFFGGVWGQDLLFLVQLNQSKQHFLVKHLAFQFLRYSFSFYISILFLFFYFSLPSITVNHIVF